MKSPGVALFQGRRPPSMASHSLFIERAASDGTKVPLLGGEPVLPGELIFATTTGIGSFIDPTITFELYDADGTLVLRAQKAPNWGSRQVSLTFNAPAQEDAYTMLAWLDNLPLLSFQHKAETTFRVSVDAPVQEAPPKDSGGFLGGFRLGDLKPLAMIVLGIVVVTALAPVVKKATGN